MQNILLQTSIIYTVVYVILCYIAVAAAGCKRTISKPTNITIVTKPSTTQEEKVATELKETTPDDILSIEDDVDTLGKEKCKEEEEKIKEIEEKLVAEEKSLQQEKSRLEKIMDTGQDSVQQGNNNNFAPSAPYETAAYNPNWPSDYLDSSLDNYPIPTSSNMCAAIDQDHNYVWDKDDLEDLLKNPSIKRRCIESYSEIVSKLRRNIRQLWKKSYIYKLKARLKELEDAKLMLEQEKIAICSNNALSNRDKKRKLEHIFIEIQKQEYEIQHLKNIIQKRQKNNKLDDTNNIDTNNIRLPQASTNGTSLYPNLSDLQVQFESR